jgi:simple sugar transport system permease protein
LLPLLAIISSLFVAGLFVLLTDAAPWDACGHMLAAGFGCQALNRCALLTTLQFATPLLLTGLSAAVAFRAGVFSVGQAGQMVLGAAAAAWLGSHPSLPGVVQVTIALIGGVVVGAAWGWVPGALKKFLNINEVIVTLVMNQLAVLLVGLVRLRRVGAAARLAPLAPGTKLNAGIILALLVAVLVYVYLWRSASGYEQRMAGQAPLFARFGGIRERRAVMRAMLISGGLAGLAGGIEVLGVHYRFVLPFSGGGGFDGVAVALLGQTHPVGVTLAAIFLAGVRLGATNGLQLKAHVPRELGGAMIAMMILFVSAERLYSAGVTRAIGWFDRQTPPTGEG